MNTPCRACERQTLVLGVGGRDDSRGGMRKIAEIGLVGRRREKGCCSGFWLAGTASSEVGLQGGEWGCHGELVVAL